MSQRPQTFEGHFMTVVNAMIKHQQTLLRGLQYINLPSRRYQNITDYFKHQLLSANIFSPATTIEAYRGICSTNKTGSSALPGVKEKTYK